MFISSINQYTHTWMCHGVLVIFIGNGHGDPSSNPG